MKINNEENEFNEENDELLREYINKRINRIKHYVMDSEETSEENDYFENKNHNQMPKFIFFGSMVNSS